MVDNLLIDKRQARRSFERAAATYDAAAVLQHEVCRRMAARLDYIRLEPAAILDGGCGTGNAFAALSARFPHARIVALDFAIAMLQRAHSRLPWWKRFLGTAPLPVCGDIEALPIRSESVDLVWSNLALQWLNDPRKVFADLKRVLRPGGLLMFSTFGPDTLKELRSAYQGVNGHTHVNRFFDMHDLGDMLVATGFADPVMDMEYITLTYSDVRQLMRELKAIGAHNVTHGRPAGLSAKSTIAKVARNYEAFRREGRLPATFEVIYGHAWKPHPRVGPSGRPVIDIKPC